LKQEFDIDEWLSKKKGNTSRGNDQICEKLNKNSLGKSRSKRRSITQKITLST